MNLSFGPGMRPDKRLAAPQRPSLGKRCVSTEDGVRLALTINPEVTWSRPKETFGKGRPPDIHQRCMQRGWLWKALSEGGSTSGLGGCYQLLLAPHSKIVNRWSCTEKNVVIDTLDLLLKTPAAAVPRRPSLSVLPCPSTRGHTLDSCQTSSRPPRNLLETSLSRDLPAPDLVSPKQCFGSPYQRAPSTQRLPPPSYARLA